MKTPEPTRLEWLLFVGTAVGIFGGFLWFSRRYAFTGPVEIAVYVLMILVGAASIIARLLIFRRWR